MKIEDYWDDKTEFYISFLTEDKRIINKIIIVDFGTTELQVTQIVKESFNTVNRVILVEERQDLLSYKNCCKIVGETRS